MLIAGFMFYVFAFTLTLSALFVVLAKNPVHSVVFLILAFFNSAGLFLLLGAEFIAMLMVIVYVGAVAVLFLFVVMMMDIDFVKLREGFVKHLPLALLIAAILVSELIIVIKSSGVSLNAAASPMSNDLTNTEAIGRILYTDYIFPFQMAGMVLLVAMVGAIVLTLRTREGVKKQDINKQLSRKREDGVELVKVQSGKGV